MDALALARWQFAATTVYHFLFVPITIGTGFLVAGLQTAWYRIGNDKYLRATKFFGKLFLKQGEPLMVFLYWPNLLTT